MSAPPLQDPTLRLLEEATNYNDWLLERARPFLGRTVLDYGAGIGTFSVRLAEAVDELVVLEPDPGFAEHLRERLAGRAARILERDTIENGSVDAIVCFNVLEHIRDDASTIARFAELLRPGGHLLLLVPGHPALFGGIDRAVEHERRYRKRDVGALLEQAGLEIRDLRRVNPIGALGWLVWSRLLGREQLPEGPTRLYDRIVPLVRRLDRIEFPFGLSVWAVGQRR